MIVFVFSVFYVISLFPVKIKTPKIHESLKKVLKLEFAEIV